MELTPESEGGSWVTKLSKLTAKGSTSRKTGKLSIQSGDIIRSPPVSQPVSPRTVTSPAPQTSNDAESPHSHVYNPMDGESPPVQPAASRKQGVVFTMVHYMVKIFFFSVKFKKTRVTLPIGSILVLIMNKLFIGAIIAVALLKFPPQINLSIKSFGIPSHSSQIDWDAYTAAENHQFSNTSQNSNTPTPSPSQRKRSPRQKRSDFHIPDCPSNFYTQYALHTNWEMDLVFRVPASNPNDNILTRERISHIHRIEDAVYNSVNYRHVCHKRSGSNLCDPLNSLLTWLYPRDRNTGKYIYNTTDGFTQDLPGTLKTLSSDLSVALWFTGGEINFVNSSYIEAKLLRSQIRVGLPLPCFSTTSDRKEMQKELVTDYFISLVPMLEEMSNSEVEVLYGGPNVFDYQVKSAIIHDAIRACYSGLVIFILMFILSGFSLWLTLYGLFAIVTCFPPAYFVYRVFFNIETVGLLNIVSIFVIIGIGVDDVFVFINTFKQSMRLPDLVDPYQRLTYTIMEASKATFFTSLTTSVAFFANTISLIPAVRQFGVFMGLVVVFCYLQVFLIIPHALYIWTCFFVHIENFIYSPIVLLVRVLKNYRSSRSPNYSNVLSIPMTNIVRDEDSGIETSSLSNSDTISDDSNQSNSDDAGGGDVEEVDQEDNDESLLVTEVMTPLVSLKPKTAETKLTLLMQTIMFGVSIVPMSLHLGISRIITKLRSCFKWPLLILHASIAFVAYLTLVGVSVGMLSNIQLTDKPPQLFDPNSNIQKMLDLAGNVTDSNAINCYNCSAWNSNSYVPTSSGNGGGNTGTTTASPPTPKPHTPTTSSTATTPTTSTPRVTTHSTPPPSSTSTPTPPPITTTNKHPPVTTPTNSGGGGGGTSTKPTTSSSGSNNGGVTTSPAPGNQGGNHIYSSRFSSNVVVHVVFGIKTVERAYDPSHVLPEEGDKIYAVLEDSFSTLLTCPYDGSKTNRIRGTLRALCRICANISNVDNKLTLEGNFQCLPAAANSLTCLKSLLLQIPECSFLLYPDYSKLSVSASGQLKRDSLGTHLQYVAMSFKSTTNPGDSPTNTIKEYNLWEKFLASELQAIKEDSSKGGHYEGAGVLLTGFQTSDHWVQVNIIAVAVDGSFYGIIISFILCSIVVVILSHDFRIVLAMVMTILAILFSLLAFFWLFDWKLGIVEAISLSILVGNSLDYCIHLSEGYVAMDARHIAFVEKFAITRGASLRVKRVMSAISFIGVSIFSSAITTMLAIIPLLGTRIQLFTRFGEILLLDTAMAIGYTLVICGNCLAFFGPPQTESKTKKIVNAVITISATIVFYLLVCLCLFIVSKFGVYIPSPQGGKLF